MTGKTLRRSHPDQTVLRVSKVRVKSVETIPAGFLPRSRLFSFHSAQNAVRCADIQPEAHDKASKCRSIVMGQLRQTRGDAPSLRALISPEHPVSEQIRESRRTACEACALGGFFQTRLVRKSISRCEPAVPAPAGRRSRQSGPGRLRSGTA